MKMKPSWWEKKWEGNFEELVEFKKKNGHVAVPVGDPYVQILHRWMNTQKNQLKCHENGTKTSPILTEERIGRLRALGLTATSTRVRKEQNIGNANGSSEHGSGSAPNRTAKASAAVSTKKENAGGAAALNKHGKPCSVAMVSQDPISRPPEDGVLCLCGTGKMIMGKAGKCRTKGCRKHCRKGRMLPRFFCSVCATKHEVTLAPVNASKLKENEIGIGAAIPPPQLETGFMDTFHVNDETLQWFNSFYRCVLKSNGQNPLELPHVRCRLNWKHFCSSMEKELHEKAISASRLFCEENKKKKGLPVELRSGELGVSNYEILVAPPVNNNSNSWTRGYVHRDSAGKNNGPVKTYTCILFLVDVTEENGAIRFWPETVGMDNPDVRHPYRMGKASKHEVSITGKAGTLLVFDAAIWHQSLPNSTTSPRPTVLWDMTIKYKRNFLRC